MKNDTCNGCPDRYVDKYVNCHSDCSRYKGYRQKIDEKNAAKKKDGELTSYIIDNMIKHQAKKNRRKKW